MLMEGMAMTLSLVGASSELGRALNKAMLDIGKHVPAGSGSPQGVSQAMKQMAMKHAQMAPHKAAMGAAAPGGAPPAPGAGAAPMPPPQQPPPGAA